MLLYPPIKDLLGQVPSRYMLVNLVASRARKLSSDSEASGEPLDIQEVADGTLTVEAAEAALAGEELLEGEDEEEEE